MLGYWKELKSTIKKHWKRLSSNLLVDIIELLVALSVRAFADISEEALPKRGIGVMFDSVVFVKTINIINCVQEGNIFGGSGIGVLLWILRNF